MSQETISHSLHRLNREYTERYGKDKVADGLFNLLIRHMQGNHEQEKFLRYPEKESEE